MRRTTTEHNTDTSSITAPAGVEMMSAIVQDRYGPPEVLSLRPVPVPEPGKGEVLIRVMASSLNMYDSHMTTGMPRMARLIAGPLRPRHRTPGADVAGVVERVGAGVTAFVPGDEVFGDIGSGSFAERAVASEGRITHKPAEVTFPQAAAVPLAGVTALQGLRDIGGLRPGQRVVVNGASGGVGTFAVQLAKVMGAEVIAVCSSGKVDTARSLGADRVLNYTSEDYTELVSDIDLLFDNAGNRPWKETSRVLAPGGINVTITGPKHGWFGPFRNLIARKLASSVGDRRFAWFTARPDAGDLAYLGSLVATGAVTPVIERTYRLAEVPDALRHLAAGHAAGKLVVVP
jgi:NADPH:quinone reductase-like Zn-dependent oxidoreductase